ncbi:MAG TPA: outer membrane beta-barrel protein, partial [Chitinophagaceae bacterium]|nr:outer membrane beta-barrel protein [Chitinophagaceae bacterium]
DKTGVIVTPVSVNGFRVSGFSSNFDWTIIKNILWRNEVRVLYSADKIFSKNNISKNNNVCFLSSIALWF